MAGAKRAVAAYAVTATLVRGADTAAALASAFGGGTLAGSLIMTARPLRGSPERAVSWAALAISATLALCALAPSFAPAALAFALAGLLSSVQFASSLAARAEYSPPEARAQIFMTMAGLKVAFSSTGFALAGIAAATAPMALLIGAGVMTVAAFTAAMLDRQLARDRSDRLDATTQGM